MARAARSIPVLAALLGALVTATPAGAGGGGCFHPISSRGGDTVEIKEFCFSPTVLEVSPGTTVTFVNRDDTRHNVVGANDAFGAFDGLRRGGRARLRFDDPGIFPYACTYHPGMTGAVLVGDGAGVAADAPGAGGAIAAGVTRAEAPGRGDSTPWRAVALVSVAAALVAIAGAIRQRTKAG